MTARRSLPDQAEVERRWQAFAEASQQAQGTMRIADGIAAGQAWAAFLDLYAARPTVTAGVLPKPVNGRAMR